MALRLLAQPLKRASAPMGTRTMAHMSYLDPKTTKIQIGVDGVPTEHHIYGHKIGKREIVGYGWNSLPTYVDRNDFPFPAIRWREESADISALRQKEKGDWKQLSKYDKKKLYRFSFCQTFAEMDAPTGEWKLCAAGALIAGALALWIAMWMRLYILPAYPSSLSEEGRKAQLKRMLEIGVGHVDGISSKWDYENKRWK